MASVTASIAARPLGTGRAILLIAASVLLHAIFLAAMRDQLAMPSFEPEPATRTIETSLIVEARPAPAAPKPVRKVAPRRPRPAPPPPVEPQTIAAPEPAPVPVAPADEPLPAAPGESDTQIGAVEFAQPVAPPADPARVEERPAETQPAPPGVDLAAELSEVGSAADALPASASYVFRTRDTRYSALTGTTILE